MICLATALTIVFLLSPIIDHLHNDSESGLHPGVPVILPSSFGGSPRAMQQNYQDATAIVAKYGKPDLFVTYTCNTNVQDIVENLRDGESYKEGITLLCDLSSP